MMNTPLLSICIPTYNRSAFLDECLASLACLEPVYWQVVEVVISDNASTDNTPDIVKKYSSILPLRYFRNDSNIGAERNIMAVAGRGEAPYVWVFGDDDVFEEAALISALANIKQGYDLILLNYSIWSRDMSSQRNPRGITPAIATTYTNGNSILAELSLHLGYISSVVVRKAIFLSVPIKEFEQYAQYGLCHLYSIYCGLLIGGRGIYLPDPVFKRREDNSDPFLGDETRENWDKYFILGTALVFEALVDKGYSSRAVRRAKDRWLKDFVVKRLLAGVAYHRRGSLLRTMFHHYRGNWRFWVACFPAFLMPLGILHRARKMYLMLRRNPEH